ncbi:hypothetical protein JKG47_07480 [Acidithiobacillus sp. MC6.1]|nr:hypothetical protein [Acidithiobacillus sp. MC6.1]
MEQETHKPAIRRICADFVEDEATDIEIMEVALGIHRIRGKADRDAKLIHVAFMSLKRTTSEYRAKTGKRYPTADDLVQWMARPEVNATTTYRELRPD